MSVVSAQSQEGLIKSEMEPLSRRRAMNSAPEVAVIRSRPGFLNGFAILFGTCLMWPADATVPGVIVRVMPGRQGVLTSENGAIFTDPNERIGLRCMANSPTEWIANIEFAGSNTTYTQAQFSMRELTPSALTMEFKSVLSIPYGQISKERIFVCRLTSNHSESVQVKLTPVSVSGESFVQMTKERAMSERESTPEPDSCNVQFTVGEFKDEYYWRCESQGLDSEPEVQAGVRFGPCDPAPLCANVFRELRVSQTCITQVNLTSVGVDWTPRPFRGPEIALCVITSGPQVIPEAAVQFFFSASRSESGALRRTIQFSQPSIDMKTLMWIEPALAKVYHTLDVFDARCVVPLYGFATPARAIARLNGTYIWESEKKIPYEVRNEEILLEHKFNISFQVHGPGVYTLECVAPVWNTTEWANHSRTIEVRTVVGPKFTSNQEVINLEDGEADRTLNCDVTGDPLPGRFAWDFGNALGVHAEASKLVITRASTKLPEIITCTATNSFNQSGTKFFNINVTSKSALIGIIAGTSGGALVLAGLLYLYWWKLKRARYLANLLTDEEVKELLKGKKATATSELKYIRLDSFEQPLEIDSLPYDSKFEIPKRNLFTDFKTELGSGQYGVVYKGLLKRHRLDRNPVPVAVKTVRKSVNVEYFKALMSELKIMIHVGQHENVVRLLGACTRKIKKRELFVVVELCKTSLLEFLQENRAQFEASFVNPITILHPLTTLSEAELIRWAAEIAAAMAFLTEKRVVHGDLAARNVLLTHDLHAQISDFGLARQLINYTYIMSEESVQRQLLPWKWMALESLCEKEFSTRSDVWAFGVTLWELFELGEEPYRGVVYNVNFLEQLGAGHRLSKPKYADDMIFRVMKRCWLPNPADRPKFVELGRFFQL